MTVVLNDVMGTRVKLATPKAGFSSLEPGVESKRRRIRDSEFVQSMKRIVRPGMIRKRLDTIEESKRDETEVNVNRIEASAAAFQAKTTDDLHEQLLLLLTAEKLYERSLEGVIHLNKKQKIKDSMACALNRALEGVRNDLAGLEGHILEDDINAFRIKVGDLKTTFVSAETEASLQKLAREHQIDSMTYRII